MKLTRTGYSIKALFVLLCFGLQYGLLEGKGKYTRFISWRASIWTYLIQLRDLLTLLNIFSELPISLICLLLHKVNSIGKNTVRIFAFVLQH